MKVLVTGAGGFLGRLITQHAVASGMDVRTLDLDFPCQELPSEQRLTGSILDRALVAQAMAGVDGVINAAAVTDLWTRRRLDFDLVNVAGAALVAAAARRCGARLVHVSSYTTLIHRSMPDRTVLTADATVPATRLLGRYPRTKRQAEAVIETATAAGLWAAMVLPTAPVGAGDHRPTPPGDLLRGLISGRFPSLLPCTLNIVDAAAVARATLAALTNGQTGGRYLLAGDDIDIFDLAKKVEAITGVAAPMGRVPAWLALAAARAEAALSFVSGRPPKAPLTGVRLALRPCRFDDTPAREELGFAPRTLGDVLPEAIEYHARYL